jgi:hypothetical protein
MLRFAPGVLELILVIFCFVDAVSARDDEVRNLPRWLWIVLIIFLPIVGPVSWLIAGRPMAVRPTRFATEFPEYDRPGRYAVADPEADAEFLRKVRERAEEQRQKAALEKRLQAEREKAQQEKERPADEA